MSKWVLFFVASILVNVCHAQQRAITDTGEEIIIYTDGTWQYVDEALQAETQISTNPTPFTKDESATFLAKSSVVDVGFWLNPKRWKFEKGGGNNSDTEYEFSLIGGDLYALAITEGLHIPLESWPDIALENARNADPNMQLTLAEYRTVNGIDVLLLRMDGNISGIALTYLGYYYSTENGAVQLLTYTGTQTFEKYRKDAFELLNGLVELQ